MTVSETDKIEIIELTARYANAMDSGNQEEWLDTWADDGVWQGGLGTYEGTASLAKLLPDLGARIQGKRHVMTNHVITADGAQAHQRCYMLVIDRETSPRILATGVYEDTLKKVSGKWKFARRKVQLDPSFKP